MNHWTKTKRDISSWRERTEDMVRTTAYLRRGRKPSLYRNKSAVNLIIEDVVREIDGYNGDIHENEFFDILARHLEYAERYPKTILLKVTSGEESCDS